MFSVPIILLLVSCIWLSLSQQVQHLNVYNEEDGVSNTDDCFPVSNSLCSLRSAWNACANLTSTDACHIHLPLNGNLVLSEGPLVLSTGVNVHLLGNYSVVQPTTSILEEDLPGAKFHSLSNTNNARVNIEEICVDACDGDTFKFSGCEDPVEDSYFRLFLNGRQVAHNDDSCVFAAEIIYTYDGSTCVAAADRALCLHVGCFDSTTCSPLVNITKTPLPSILPRFIEYVSNSSDAPVPQLSVSNLFLSEFGLPGMNGGAFYLDGPAHVTLDAVIFVKNVGRFGAAIWAANNEMGLTISECMFDECATAANGGGVVSLYEGTANVKITDSSFVECTALEGGGGLHVGRNNTLVQVQESYFSACSAGTVGGAVQIGDNNSHIDFTQNTVQYCDSQDGALSIGHGNADVTVDQSTFHHNTALDSGGSVHIGARNERIHITGCSFTSSFAIRRGGGIYVGLHNRDINVSSSIFGQCITPGGLGGGLFVTTNNVNIELFNATFRDCSAGKGGGFYAAISNTPIVVEMSQFEKCEASEDGGGVYFENRNHDAFFVESTFTECSAEQNGGAMFVSGSFDASFLQVDFSHNSAELSGGALYLDKTEGAWVNDCTFSHNNAQVFGGGIFSATSSQGLTIAGCQLDDNHAENSGGALSVQGGNSNLVITDAAMAEKAVVIESPHPYETPGTAFDFFQQEVNDSSVSEYIIHFDPLTELGFDDVVVIRSLHHKIRDSPPLLFGRNDRLPGVDAPSIRVKPPFRVLLTTKREKNNPSVQLSDDIYGYTLYATPVPDSFAAPTVFSNNSAGNRGGAVSIHSAVDFANIVGVQYLSNSAGTGGAMFSRVALTGMSMESCEFTDNQASSDGGALVLAAATAGFLATRCQFDGNFAQRNGGAVAIGGDNGIDGALDDKNDVMFRKCNFENNLARMGGAIHADKGNKITMTECTLSKNVAMVSGGGLLASLDNEVTLYQTKIASNVAQESGGGLTGLTSNTFKVSTCTLQANYAGTVGGAIYFEKDVQMEIYDNVVFGNNTANLAGGAIASVSSPMWKVPKYGTDVFFISNVAQRGSALYFRGLQKLSQDGDIDLLGHHFEENVATIGGTVYWMYDRNSSAVPFPPSMNDQNATAESVSSQPDADDFSDDGDDFISPFDNFNSFWNFNDNGNGIPDDDGDYLVESKKVSWIDNVAPYGERFATQAMQILGPREYTAVVYGSALSPPLNFSLVDFYGQHIPVESTLGFDASILEVTSVETSIVGADASQCNGQFPFLTGAGAVENVKQGVATFDELVVQCAPEGAITLNFEARLLDLKEVNDDTLTSYFISNRTEMSFRSCKAGEFIANGQCVTCPVGSYSLEAVVTTDTTCRDASNKKGVRTSYADYIAIKSGYWRRFPTSHSVLQCSNELSGCEGGDGTGDSLCVEGHEGPLCAVCSDGYFKDDAECSPCENSGNIRPVTAFYLAIAAFIVAVLIFLFYSNCLDPTFDDEIVAPNGSGKDGDVEQATTSLGEEIQSVSSEATVKPSVYEAMKVWVQAEFNSLKTKAKIIITTYQILSSIPETTNVQFPAAFSKFLSAFNVFNLNVVSTVPLECSRSVTFIDKLIFTTLFPIALALLLFLLFVFEVVVYVRTPFKLNGNVHKTKMLMGLKDKYLTYFFFLTYFVLPSVATMIFQTFLCTNVDPSEEDDASDDYFLTADMSISCTSDYYYRGVAYAAVMLLLYVVGIPALYLAMLYYNREELMTRDDVPHTFDAGTQTEAVVDADHPVAAEKIHLHHHHVHEDERAKPKVLSARAARLSFLWDAYEPQFWYWEVVETTRRLMLTAVLSVCGAGTSPQAIFAILLALMYIKLYGYYKPYVEDKDDILAETGQFQIFLSFLGALIYQRSLLGPDWNIYVSALLILINMAISLFFTYFEVSDLFEQIQEFRRDQRAQSDEEISSRISEVGPDPISEVDKDVNAVSVDIVEPERFHKEALYAVLATGNEDAFHQLHSFDLSPSSIPAPKLPTTFDDDLAEVDIAVRSSFR